MLGQTTSVQFACETGSGPAHMASGVLSTEDVSSYNFCLLGPITSGQITCELWFWPCIYDSLYLEKI